MKTQNVFMSGLSVAIAAIGCMVYAQNEPAKWEFRNIPAGNDMSVLEFKAIAKAATQPTTAPDPNADYKTQIIRVCKVTGEPVPNQLVQAIQYRGGTEILADTCTTSAEGMCTVTIEATANGRIQVADQDPGLHIVFFQKTPADLVGPCVPTSIPAG